MGETEQILREMLGEMREQTTHLRNIQEKLKDVATCKDLENTEDRVNAEIAKGNSKKDNLIYAMTAALIILAGATTALKYLG